MRRTSTRVLIVDHRSDSTSSPGTSPSTGNLLRAIGAAQEAQQPTLFKIVLHVQGEERTVHINPGNDWSSVKAQLLEHLHRFKEEDVDSEEEQEGSRHNLGAEYSFVGRSNGRAGDLSSNLSVIECDYAWLEVVRNHVTSGITTCLIVRETDRKQLKISSEFQERIRLMKSPTKSPQKARARIKF